MAMRHFDTPISSLKQIPGLLLLLILPAAVSAQIYFDTHPDSKLWLEGSSTVHRFDCVARSIEGTAYFDERLIQKTNQSAATGGNASGHDMPDYNNSNLTINSGDIRDEEAPDSMDENGMDSGLYVNLKIPIQSFDCGRSRMNRDMYEALKSDTYDYITFEFENAKPVVDRGAMADSLRNSSYDPYMIEGVLNVAGVDRVVSLILQGRAEGDRQYRIKGHKEISMKDFDIEPPTALRGLIRAHDELTVFFDILVNEKRDDS